MPPVSNYFSGLNGIRAIAALAVVMSHITLSLNYFGLDPYLFGRCEDGTAKGLMLARYGVSIFFVLSGFLITWLLLREKESGRISIRKFYLRRILRIWPLYYFYLIIIVLLGLIAGDAIPGKSLLMYIFYAANFPYMFGLMIPLVGHYWSLGVEEQFYLFWPWLMKIRTNRLLMLLVVLIALFITSRILLHYLVPGSMAEEVLHICRFHNMMIGAAGAILYYRNHQLFLRISGHILTQAVCWIILALVLLNRFHIASIIDNEIICMVALFLIIGQIRIKNRLLNLENPVMNYLGKISYGIYVYHPLVIYTLYTTLNFNVLPNILNYLAIYLVSLSLTIGIAGLSFRYFETWFLNLKKRYEVVRVEKV